MNDDGLLGGPLGGAKEGASVASRVADAYANGASDIEVCKIMEITLVQFKRMYDSNEDFHNAVNLGRVMSHAWWVEQGRRNLFNQKFNNNIWLANMKHRFGWDKADNANQDLGEGNVDQLRDRLIKLIPGALSRIYPEMSQSDLLAMAGKQSNG